MRQTKTLSTRRGRSRLGLAIDDAVVRAVLVVDRRILWRGSMFVESDETVEDTVARLLCDAPERPKVAVLALGNPHARLRALAGLPDGLTSREVDELVALNHERFFAVPYHASMVTQTRSMPDGTRWAAVFDRDVVEEMARGCVAAGCELQRVVAASGLEIGAGEDDPFSAAYAAATYAPARFDCMPDSVAARQRQRRTARGQVAIATALLATGVAALAPTGGRVVAGLVAERQLPALLASTTIARARLDSIVIINTRISRFMDEDRETTNASREFERLLTFLPADAVLQRVRIDSAGTEFTILAPDGAGAVEAIAKARPNVQLMGPVTAATSPSQLEMATLRLSQTRKNVVRRAPRSTAAQ